MKTVVTSVARMTTTMVRLHSLQADWSIYPETGLLRTRHLVTAMTDRRMEVDYERQLYQRLLPSPVFVFYSTVY